MTKKIIEISGLDFSYQREKVLENVSLQIEAGDFLGLIGPNGGGKSTLLKIILGLLEVKRGRVKLFGQEVKDFRDWHKIGYVAQKAGFNPTGFPITVSEVISMAGGKGVEIERVLKLTNLLSKKNHLLSELSGGQQQRVFIARALLHEPQLLILDEPTVGIDGNSQVQFYDLLRQLNQEKGLNIILVSHEVDLVAKEVNKIACINQSLIYHGQAQQLLENDLLEKLYGKHQRLIAHHH
jgi:zinc transport system ATP-binding protein